MYLKNLEMSGFKSFADKTKLDFEPGLTAIVGPNGCGKSNVSDAIRWVLGEQSAKAMRGSSMEDCIFTGTDNRKPMGMAEVTMTLADCEAALGTEYNEVTISRRVFRSGEGQYFINKTPCRLRDIHRMFMDTGVGTTSYSVMEQGKIDRVLSSRPEDRRAVFEEASGITKFKSDKKEAIRKLEHTEANLLRLADVIREVKRQIGSLQRQAGKARRYKELRDELRKQDLHLTRHRLQQADGTVKRTHDELAALTLQIETAQAEVREMEQDSASLRDALMRTEREIGAVHETRVQAQADLDHTRQVAGTNRQRIEEYDAWARRDSREVEDLQRQAAEKRQELARIAGQIEVARTEHQTAKRDMDRCAERHATLVEQMDRARSHIQHLRQESIQLESLAARIQNQTVEIETREHATVIRRERLAAEKAQLARSVSSFEERRAGMAEAIAGATAAANESEGAWRALEARKNDLAQRIHRHEAERAELKSKLAAAEVQVRMLREAEASRQGLAGGFRALTDPANPLGVAADRLLGPLANRLDVEPAYRLALETALRAWADAVLVADPADAAAILDRLAAKRPGAARIVAGAGACEWPAAPDGVDRLADHVRCDEPAVSAIRRLIGHVRVVKSLADAPSPLPAGTACVTLDGLLVRADGAAEFWMPEPHVATPLARRHKRQEAEAAMSELAGQVETVAHAIQAATAESEATDRSLRDARTDLDSRRRTLAQKEGESQVVERETREARQRLETASWELDQLASEGHADGDQKKRLGEQWTEAQRQKEDVTSQLHARTEELRDVETRHAQSNAELTERRVLCEGLRHKLDNVQSQHDSLAGRVAEMDATADGRARSIQGYRDAMESLSKANAEAETKLAALAVAVADSEGKAELLKKNQGRQAAELHEMEKALAEKRDGLETLRQTRAQREVTLAETRMRRQNQLDRVAQEYGVTLQAILDHPDPEWEGPAPAWETIETQIAEIRTKIEAMGPVNLVAIEEYGQLEERYAFLTNQEADLQKAKQQLMDLIRKINKTTSELFGATFAKINENFDAMFRRLFNGGTAKLVLVNEEDILECGIEIIARPPGKKLQNISLLSGGERTLTAVALLFAIYMIKPSPFCLLDELDAPLDDSNIGRFIEVLQSFISQSQFIIITHNQHTIGAANVLYGVTMPEKGISKLVSMRLQRETPEPALVT